MALSVTCACGARFDLEDTLAGQTITCPECQQPLKAPSLQTTTGSRRTNLLALLSAGMALVGAFTPLIGQAAAVVLGSLALVRINRNREREAGAGLALFGIIGGVVFGTLMVFALFAGEIFGLVSWWRTKTLGDQVETSGALEFIDKAQGFAISRPSRKWAVVVNKDIDDPFVQALEKRNCDLMLISLTRPVFIDVQTETVNRSLDEWENTLLDEWRPDDPVDLGFRPGRRNPRPLAQPGDNLFQPKLEQGTLRKRPLEVLNGEGRELEMDVLVANQRFHVLIRLYKERGNQKLHIVRAIAQREKNFKAAKPEIDAILDSFKIIPTR